MCRIAATVNFPSNFSECLHRQQANGATRRMESFTDGAFTMVHSRFDVTTQGVPTGEHPYRDGSYVLHYNGEVFACGDEVFDPARYQSDVNFAAATLSRHGFHEWLTELDFQGTIQVFDRNRRKLYVAVDQLNTQGGFYARWQGKVVVAQEVAIVAYVLAQIGASQAVAIELIRPGHYITIDESGHTETKCYRTEALRVYQGESNFAPEDFWDAIQKFHLAFHQSIERRIPQGEAPVGVLCSGGVDSSYLLSSVARILKARGELKRLHVFTLGWDLDVESECNDWENSLHLFKLLELGDQGAVLHQIPPLKGCAMQLYRQRVFCVGVARLITPNPVLNTQVRHTVRMSAMLEFIAREVPELRVVLSGDGADELFAGYNSMWEQCATAAQVRANVLTKLQDLTLNDFARVSLAAFHGACATAKDFHIARYLKRRRADQRYARLADVLEFSTAEELQDMVNELGIHDKKLMRMLATLHPIEVRLPFASHLVLRSLQAVDPGFLIGKINGKLVSKFFLRCAAEKNGLNAKFCWRKKIPMHEGGTGVRNSDRFPMEAAIADQYAQNELGQWRSDLRPVMRRLSLGADSAGRQSEGEQVVVVKKAEESGLDRLLRGNSFREQMPDCIYSTTETQSLYVDTMFEYLPERDALEVLNGLQRPTRFKILRAA